jgi:hypothetical protein
MAVAVGGRQLEAGKAIPAWFAATRTISCDNLGANYSTVQLRRLHGRAPGARLAQFSCITKSVNTNCVIMWLCPTARFNGL